MNAALGQDVDELLEELRMANEAYSKQKSECDYLDKIRKVVLYDVIENLRTVYQGKEERVTEKQLEAEARSHSRYKTLLNKRRHEYDLLAEKEAYYYHLRRRYDFVMESIKYLRSEFYLHKQAEQS